ncbi:MAG: ROK family protein [Spirochaetia bacterium]|nr:ROK family protein [Spirochaetota bacterium]MCX8096673.1 ROK family protein [Spirochaetota bacterium]MDW8112504.1 ROK family protein [Spirochaetia bacterium]
MYVGIDLGGTNIKAGMIDDEGMIVSSLSIPTEANQGWDKVISNIKKILKDLVSDRVKAIGIGIPGPVDFERGIIKEMPAIPGAKNVEIAKEIQSDFKKPTFVDNDANNFALGEVVFGVAKGKKYVIGITLGTGIGGGIVIDGRLYRGSRNYAGEVGHMVISPNGQQCNCGKFGCWEAYGSATAIIRNALSSKKRDINSKLNDYPSEKIDAKLVIELSKEGDEFCSGIAQNAFFYIGIGIASLVNILNPEMVVIGGGVSLAGEYLIKTVRRVAFENILPPLREGLEIALSRFGNNAGMLGAAGLAKTEFERLNV